MTGRRHPLRTALLTAAGLLTAGAGLLVTGAASAAPPITAAAAGATADIPPAWRVVYSHAAGACPGLDPALLAAVGKVESDHGRAASLVSSVGAVGPLQFQPATWVRWGVDANVDGSADPYDPPDAATGAARYLCAAGAVTDPAGALATYNCGNTGSACRAATTGYVRAVLGWAARYRGLGAPDPQAVGLVAVRAALTQVGAPYVWGGTGAGGFDCSGLTQWAYAQAGIALPRVAADQYVRGPHLDAGAVPVAGDLVFFGADPAHVEHVGIALGDGRMLDAPHTGAVVRVDWIAAFTPRYLGVTRPALTGGSPS